ncbi:alpha/beta hydrolase [Bdellovibrio sp. 22V]|uniref:dienelactone hydrolase family protein n=1 Tax=Bdellovibrio TaxID=958 RepID=UPI002542D720|nr:alpha/beta hydrolase [Bdellovibrio sp. 22V]WII72385.1 alpha/beta hydrolase [Bdellovibrio sp. 22V]
MVSHHDLTDIEKEIEIPSGDLRLKGILGLPEWVTSIVIFAHGSGSSRWSSRNNFVAHVLQKRGLGTLLMDLLTEEESNDRNKVFDVELLAERLQAAKKYLSTQAKTKNLPVAYFGASTGAAAALTAAAHDRTIFAVVSRGGRPDLAEPNLKKVKAPTLLIVGGNDPEVMTLNKKALAQMKCEKQLIVVSGATHLFEESGTLEQVTHHAVGWFLQHLPLEKTKEASL